MNKNKFFISLLFGLIFLESVIIIILPSNPVKNDVKRVNTPPQTPTPAPIEWQTYSNEKYGFEFQYPNNYIFDEGNIISVSNPEEKYSRILIDFQQFKNLPIPLTQYFKNKTPSEVCIDNFCPVEYEISVLPNSTLISYDFGFSSKFNYLFYKPGYGHISLNYELGGDMDDPGRETVDSYQKIISTFKFLPDTTTWKTYINQKYGFQFQYPNSWYMTENKLFNRGLVTFWKSKDDYQKYIDWDNKMKKTNYIVDEPEYPPAYWLTNINAYAGEIDKNSFQDYAYNGELKLSNATFSRTSSGGEIIVETCSIENGKNIISIDNCVDNNLADFTFNHFLSSFKITQ